MRVVIQRVSSASVVVDQAVVGSIGKGLMVLLGVEHDDTEEDATWLAGKLVQMRIFADAEDKMNLNVQDVDGEVLVVSQFTLHASTKKGNRPSFIRAARPEKATPLYEFFLQTLEQLMSKRVAKGIFGADMKVSLVNDGPVTITMDSRSRE
jgi:D-tyrosyl-tRNA(Tyr) deacylase